LRVHTAAARAAMGDRGGQKVDTYTHTSMYMRRARYRLNRKASRKPGRIRVRARQDRVLQLHVLGLADSPGGGAFDYAYRSTHEPEIAHHAVCTPRGGCFSIRQGRAGFLSRMFIVEESGDGRISRETLRCAGRLSRCRLRRSAPYSAPNAGQSSEMAICDGAACREHGGSKMARSYTPYCCRSSSAR
jgi:hypothetical protein